MMTTLMEGNYADKILNKTWNIKGSDRNSAYLWIENK